ncbi:hypothetical protein E4U57_006224 [Claviceps arundinis]|uniref:Uncharacterized protein n=1 Tax=Claviceps arundinis TaxID=1623583 RepID=A0A9P7MWT7_9HYPO|nr:hypothetical protein E4U57_006224 [Claviceps arundinis]KAG5972752.1 hypothetical protein E4U56_005778 [Claviceps arundinis]
MKPWWAVAELPDAGNPARVLKLFNDINQARAWCHHGDRGQLQSPLAPWSCRKESDEPRRSGVLQYIHSQALEMVIENLQKARERLKSSHREDGTPFTHSAIFANSDNTENRCCNDCVCNNESKIALRAWGCHATTRS